MEVTNVFVQAFLRVNNLNILEMDETKNWGGYYIFEADEKSDRKLIWLKPKKVLALKYHGIIESQSHFEEWKALTAIRVLLGSYNICETPGKFNEDIRNLNIINLEPNQVLEIPTGFLHSLVNPFQSSVFLYEKRVSLKPESYIDREKNTKAIYDNSGEYKAPFWPVDILERAMTI